MTPTERQLAAILREPTDRISLDAICVENVAQVAELLGCAETEVHDRLGIDGRVVAAGYAGEGVFASDGRPLDEWRSDAWLDYHIKSDVSAENTVELFHTAIAYTARNDGLCSA